MKRRTLFILLGLIALIVILAVVFGGRREEGTRIFTTEVEKRAIQEKVAASGKVFPQTEVKISSDVSGEIVELYVEEGDSVVAGQLLAKIDADTYQSQVARGEAGVNSAKANEANAKAQIKTLEASKEQIQAQLKNAQEIYDRNLKLREEGVISQADLEASLSSLDALKANFRSAESNIQAARESAKAAQYQVKSSAATLEELRTSLRRTTIYAPMGGVISLLYTEQGN
ncbi:MAG: biotin/lipoyl-binding protein, partial [Bacteroidota bacterium]